MPIDFNKKLRPLRPHPSGNDLQRALESDRGRIINSAAIRRLQQKTQVFPLERNAAVRSRLTHSLEVQQVGRFIVQTIFNTLTAQQLQQYHLADHERSLETLVEMACLMHDIGNPPFGHFGEAAIIDWFKKHLTEITSESTKAQPLWSQLSTDICHFEGNAQAIRIIHSLLRLNLTFSQAAGILKYTRPAWINKTDIPRNQDYLMKKVGFYYSEKDYINELQSALNMQPGQRHPACYIMEAADDISYCLADIEDAVEKGIMSHRLLCDKLIEEFSHVMAQFALTEHTTLMEKAVTYATNKAEQDSANFVAQFFVYLRVKLIHPLVTHAATRFIDNIEGVFNGDFNQALLEDKSHLHAITQTLKNVALKYVFSHKEVERLELQGYRIISGLLDCYQPLLTLGREAFNAALTGAKGYLIESRLINKLSNKHKSTYLNAVNALSESDPNRGALEFYYRCRLIQDYISGMTDQFAFDEYRMLMVID